MGKQGNQGNRGQATRITGNGYSVAVALLVPFIVSKKTVLSLH
jgi:hypothetical protein